MLVFCQDGFCAVLPCPMDQLSLGSWLPLTVVQGVRADRGRAGSEKGSRCRSRRAGLWSLRHPSASRLLSPGIRAGPPLLQVLAHWCHAFPSLLGHLATDDSNAFRGQAAQSA